ncbi:MAG: hypothetical protein ABSG73_13305 [Candidatus Aminicenantales bacterium]|jgi:hypothetical protein
MDEKKVSKMEGIDIAASIMAGVRIPKDKDVGRPVVNAAGEIIGHTTTEAMPTIQDAADVLLVGMRAEAEKRKAEIGKMLDEAAEIAWQAGKKTRPRLNFLSFTTKLDVQAKLAELGAKRDKINRAIDEALAALGDAPEYKEWRRAVGEQRNDIRDVFDGKA